MVLVSICVTACDESKALKIKEEKMWKLIGTESNKVYLIVFNAINHIGYLMWDSSGELFLHFDVEIKKRYKSLKTVNITMITKVMIVVGQRHWK